LKTKRSDFVNKILFIVIAAILSGLLIAFMIGLYKDKKQELNTSTSKIKNATGSVSNFDYEPYDGNTISGETLVKLIKEVTNENEEFSVAVQTFANANKSTPVTIYYNRALSATNNNITTGTVTSLDQSSKSSDNYITPTANFLGQVLKNPNDEVIGILFIQKK
jgi:hypothetical protein